MKRFTALFLVFTLLLLPGGMTAQKKKGADIEILKIDGKQVWGELIAVKGNVLIILELLSNVDVSVDIAVIKDITIVRKSKAKIGILIGVPLGAIIGYVTHQKPVGGFTFNLLADPKDNAIWGGILGGLAGLGIGLLLGTDEIFQIEGMSEGEVRGILESLRKKSRVPDYK